MNKPLSDRAALFVMALFPLLLWGLSTLGPFLDTSYPGWQLWAWLGAIAVALLGFVFAHGVLAVVAIVLGLSLGS